MVAITAYRRHRINLSANKEDGSSKQIGKVSKQRANKRAKERKKDRRMSLAARKAADFAELKSKYNMEKSKLEAAKELLESNYGLDQSVLRKRHQKKIFGPISEKEREEVFKEEDERNKEEKKERGLMYTIAARWLQTIFNCYTFNVIWQNITAYLRG